MKIQFESTVDDLVDCQTRLLTRSSAYHKMLHRWIIIPLPVVTVICLLLPFDLYLKLFVYLWSCTGVIGYILLDRKYLLKRRIRKYFIEALGSDQPFPCEIEAGDVGITYRREGVDLLLHWSQATEVNDNPDDIEVYFQKQACIVLPNRIFSTPEQREEWLSFIRKALPLPQP